MKTLCMFFLITASISPLAFSAEFVEIDNRIFKPKVSENELESAQLEVKNIPCPDHRISQLINLDVIEMFSFTELDDFYNEYLRKKDLRTLQWIANTIKAFHFFSLENSDLLKYGHTFNDCDDLNLVSQLVSPSTLIILNASIFFTEDTGFSLKNEVLQIIKNMRDKGADVLLLNEKDKTDAQINLFFTNLKKVGMDSQNLSGFNHAKEESSTRTREKPLFKEGVIFAGDFGCAEALRQFISAKNYSIDNIETVAFLDDNKDNCLKVNALLKEKENYSTHVFYLRNKLENIFSRQADNNIDENSATVNTKNKDLECPLCFELCPDLLATKCKSNLCDDCLRYFCSVRVTQIEFKDDPPRFEIACPAGCKDASCRYEIAVPKAEELFGRERLNNLVERASRNIPDSKGCPGEKCTNILLRQEIELAKEQGQPYVVCSECETRMCLVCERVENNGHNCLEQSQRIRVPYGDNFKPCPVPGCKKDIEKKGGCLSVQCGKDIHDASAPIFGCGAVFCWNCGIWTENVPNQEVGLFKAGAKLYLPKTRKQTKHGGTNPFDCQHTRVTWW